MSFATAAANRDQRWTVLIRIEGVGDYNGQYVFCPEVPDYATGLPSYKPWLAAYPKTLTETVGVHGGVAEAGELSFAVLDGDDITARDDLTAKFRTTRTPTTILDGAINASVTTVNVADASGIAANDVIYVAGEAMRVTAKVSNALTVTRAWLGTTAASHDDDDPVLLSTPYMRGRRVRLYLAPSDGTDVDETLLGTYHLDGLALGQGLGTWAISARSMQSYLGRLIASRPRNYRVESIIGGAGGRVVLELLRTDRPTVSRAGAETFSTTGETWFRVGKEIVRGTIGVNSIDREYLTVTDRAQLGSQPEELKVGMPAAEIYVADASNAGNGSFRYSPGPTPATNRTVGTWRKTAHFVDILLCLLTSSVTEDDALELANYLGSGSDAARSNWSSLRVGIGIGVPIALIDVDSFLSVRQRTDGYDFGAFVVGDEAVNFASLVSEHLLKTVGAYLTIVGEKVTLILPRATLAGESTTAVGDDQILVEPIGRRAYFPTLTASQDLAMLISSVLYRLRDPDGTQHSLVVIDPAQPTLYGPGAAYAPETRTLELPAPSVRTDVGRALAFLTDRGLKELRRWGGKPQWIVNLETDVSMYALAVGSLAAITFVDLPNDSTGTRGWISVGVQTLEKTYQFNDNRTVTILWKFTGYGAPSNIGKISPAAKIASVSGNVATISANRYTHSDAAGDLPAADAAAFASSGDVLAICDRDGTRPTVLTQTVVSKSGNDLTLDGNFGGALTSGRVLIFANRASAASQQYSVYVYWADRATKTIGATTEAPWHYAEP